MPGLYGSRSSEHQPNGTSQESGNKTLRALYNLTMYVLTAGILSFGTAFLKMVPDMRQQETLRAVRETWHFPERNSPISSAVNSPYSFTPLCVVLSLHSCNQEARSETIAFCQ